MKVILKKIIGIVLLIASNISVFAASSIDIDKLTTYSVILGRAVACGADVEQASGQVGDWMEKNFSNTENATYLPIFMNGMAYHAQQQRQGNSPDSCSAVIRAFNNTSWPQ